MAVEQSRVTTYSCDSEECDNTRTVVGEFPIDQIKGYGWETITIKQKTYDLCAECFKELEEFLFGEEVSSESEIVSVQFEAKAGS